MKYIKALAMLLREYLAAFGGVLREVLAHPVKYLIALLAGGSLALLLPAVAVGVAGFSFTEAADTHMGKAIAGVAGMFLAGYAALFVVELLILLSAVSATLMYNQFEDAVLRRVRYLEQQELVSCQ